MRLNINAALVAVWFVVAALAMPSHSAPPDVLSLDNPPVVMLANSPLNSVTAELFAFDSLRVVVAWSHPADGGGNEDSTTFRIRASRTLRFTGGGSVAPETWRRRRHLTATTADTFKLLRPNVGDTVIFSADSIQQWRRNAGSVPGSAAWGYQRSAAPPAMTFIRVSTDSF